jgi:hypothetical protein
MLINNLVGSIPNPRYIEIGCWAGSTACAAMYGNQAKVTCIDNWSGFGGPREEFLANINQYRNACTDFEFVEADFRKIDYAPLGKHNIYFFDGPHGYQDQFDGAIVAVPALDREWIFIADDWNAPEIRKGTLDGLSSRGLEPLYTIEIRTTQDGSHAAWNGTVSDWHNGSYLAVLRR